MKAIWFRSWRGLLLPVHFMGVLVILLAVAFLIPVCFAVCCTGYAMSDDLYHTWVQVECHSKSCVHGLVGFTFSFFWGS